MCCNKCSLEACPAQEPIMELLSLMRGLGDKPQMREVLKAIGTCSALRALEGSDLAIEAEREAHEEKINRFTQGIFSGASEEPARVVYC